MKRHLRIVTLVLLLFIVVGCDQSSKAVARRCLESQRVVEFAGGTVRLALADNNGAFLGLGSSLPSGVRVFLLVSLVGSALFVGLFYLIHARSLSLSLFLAGGFVVAGGFGNLVDRVFRSGIVTDFVMIRLGSIQTGVFNVADVAIVVGVLIGVFSRRELRKHDDIASPDKT